MQEKKIHRLGSNKPIDIEVRIISATNANIMQKIQNGEFRQDLYYRLNTIPISIPPLRERKEEIELIAKHHLQKICQKHALGEKILSDSVLEELQNYEWPGNVRELLSVIERAAILSDDETITTQDLFLDSRI